MENPCDKCVVNPCCTQLCENKRKYTEELHRELEFLAPELFMEDGYRKENVPKQILKEKNQVVRLLKKNGEELRQIWGFDYSGTDLLLKSKRFV